MLGVFHKYVELGFIGQFLLKYTNIQNKQISTFLKLICASFSNSFTHSISPKPTGCLRNVTHFVVTAVLSIKKLKDASCLYRFSFYSQSQLCFFFLQLLFSRLSKQSRDAPASHSLLLRRQQEDQQLS